METIYIESIDSDVKPETNKPYEKIVIRKPKPPKIAKVKRFKQVGNREWETIYRVKDEFANIVYSDPILKKAVCIAKDLSIKKLKEYYITVDKALTNSDPITAIVTPGKHRLGKFKFVILDTPA